MEKKFLSAPDAFGYFSLDVCKRIFEQKSSSTISNLINQHVPPINAGRFLKHAADEQKAQLLFDLIFPRLPEEYKCEENFSITLVSKKTNQSHTISILDYIFALTDPQEPVNVELHSLHKYVMSFVHIPNRLIANKKFKRCFL